MNEISRRSLFRAAGVSGAAIAAGLALPGAATAAPELLTATGPTGTTPVQAPHTTFGADPAREVVVSWTSPSQVHRPLVRIGTTDGGFGRVVHAETTRYVDHASNREVFCHHASVRGLHPDRHHVFQVRQGDAAPVSGTFRTAPDGRAPFRFTSFGDQATPTPGDTLWSPHAADIVDQVETVDPLFHLMNGDLCYANISPDRIKTWQDWFANNARSMRNRPWMPAAGNHENELGNGPIGFAAYQSLFRLPAPHGVDEETKGLWYSYTVGSVRFVHLNNDDVAYQDGGNSYVRGYSGGAQRRWLEAELASARCDHRIDWIVVCMHQVVISSADFNGADLGIREEFAPLFDRYGVDLVLCGHEHHYERSHPVRGVESGSATLTPRAAATDLRRIDTTKGTVHMILGGGGTSAPSNQTLFTPPKAKIITGVGPVGANGKRPSVFAYEQAGWSAVRDHDHAYGFAGFEVDPGRAGGKTTIKVTYYDSLGSGAGNMVPFDEFVLERPRRDHRGGRDDD
ncbi:purple acid phosphatase family protein [Solihabitans fulvus]|uniref:purple acid phosphatase family protein n=1 Tax=Solihabitans fulvus TaxID=1892852 RepID=UPI001CB75ED2|nr:metallophosphoesterase family protein [Solihabitans fulvus]